MSNLPYSMCLAVDRHLGCLQWTPSEARSDPSHTNYLWVNGSEEPVFLLPPPDRTINGSACNAGTGTSYYKMKANQGPCQGQSCYTYCIVFQLSVSPDFKKRNIVWRLWSADACHIQNRTQDLFLTMACTVFDIANCFRMPLPICKHMEWKCLRAIPFEILRGRRRKFCRQLLTHFYFSPTAAHISCIIYYLPTHFILFLFYSSPPRISNGIALSIGRV